MCGRNRKGEGKLNTPLSSSPHPGKMSPPPEGKSLIQRPGELPSAGHASGRPSGLRAAGGGPSAKATEISVFVLFRVFFFWFVSPFLSGITTPQASTSNLLGAGKPWDKHGKPHGGGRGDPATRGRLSARQQALGDSWGTSLTDSNP